MRFTLQQIHQLTVSALVAQGCSVDQADAIADIVAAAERDRCISHGVFRIPFYVQAMKAPGFNPHATPSVAELAPSVVHVEGGNGFSPLALRVGLPLLIEHARRQGIAALSINNACHIAALWPEVETVVEAGLVAFAFVSGRAYVAPAGGSKALFGTNPMAFGWPRSGGRLPLVFDQASSVCARGEIQLHQRAGEPLPLGWALNAEGAPTTDPAAALQGAQLAFGGYKGASIALMIELLAGALVGDSFSFAHAERNPGSTALPCRGEFMIAIDPARCLPNSDREQQLAHAETLFTRILEQEGTRLPSNRRYTARQAFVDGTIEVPDALYHTVRSFIGNIEK